MLRAQLRKEKKCKTTAERIRRRTPIPRQAGGPKVPTQREGRRQKAVGAPERWLPLRTSLPALIHAEENEIEE